MAYAAACRACSSLKRIISKTGQPMAGMEHRGLIVFFVNYVRRRILKTKFREMNTFAGVAYVQHAIDAGRSRDVYPGKRTGTPSLYASLRLGVACLVHALFRLFRCRLPIRSQKNRRTRGRRPRLLKIEAMQHAKLLRVPCRFRRSTSGAIVASPAPARPPPRPRLPQPWC